MSLGVGHPGAVIYRGMDEVVAGWTDERGLVNAPCAFSGSLSSGHRGSRRSSPHPEEPVAAP